ncbi:agamous-like MADS-box protein AGL61 [Lotus japonicus]|uniref:agamous-like MADS-box protein AGL61 n=1 Tax=Lotus japonicus TaxID=34305 RepID=UPI00258B8239|nr:agamous-like MADS-box protein AGL61 [Lotus japonicus]
MCLPLIMSTAGTSGMKGRGRKIIEIKKIIKESSRQVTFSKCRNGLFKKASELCTLCGVELVLIIFSPSGKVFSFGHPGVEDVIQRYLSQDPPPTSEIMWYIQVQRNANVCELNAQLSNINNHVDASKNYGKELNRLLKEAQAQLWWARQVEEMDKPQLEKYRAILYELKKLVTSYGAIVGTNSEPHHLFDDVGGPSNVMVPVHHPSPPPHHGGPPGFF